MRGWPPPVELTLALLLDRLLGDPPRGHPVRWIGTLGHLGFRLFRGGGRTGGLGTLFLVVTLFGGGVLLSVRLFPPLEVLWLFYFVALTSLEREVLSVGRALERGDLGLARRRLSFLVSRRTEVLPAEGVIRGALETLAENFNDAFCGPLFWYLVGGLPAAILYKVTEILDSMFGYRHGPYRDFGFFPARTDDVLNFLPARFSALFLALAAPLVGLSPVGAFRTALRDASVHPSPNSGWPQAALAGALGVALGGPIPYPGGLQQRAFMGTPLREVEIRDIKIGVRLVRAAAFLFAAAILVGEVFLWKSGCRSLIELITKRHPGV
ncbi:adenosylcobinamide-phosphate synthase CbiB [Thermosulfurimonas sp. F29]|uniref:adenosylcobinamide-phosphate synthase CbiB n=1 Tax=Thermosulfurimonas sp. F29 TaxID=2867247 RepID=UPI001C8364B2|nr:adenosylcobinamide-phosphate synthase CbiB [Thermosulfurimonas sp. F29]MBX6422189.1 adenosylcobinamide-phosphate synthase CbiB [Thermosulfurimonas sp. F29]